MSGKAPKQQDLEALATSLGAKVVKKGSGAAASSADWVVRGIGGSRSSATAGATFDKLGTSAAASGVTRELSEEEWWQELECRGWEPSKREG